MGLGRTQHCPRCGHTLWTDGPAQIQDRDLQPYFSRRIELSVEGGVVLWGLRVVIPERLLEELYEEHSGMFRMKALARSFLWCPGLDQQIERKVSMLTCTRVANTPPTAPLQTWTWPVKAWQRVHLDYAEHDGRHYFLLVDAHSKWPEAIPTSSTTTDKTITIPRNLLRWPYCGYIYIYIYIYIYM